MLRAVTGVFYGTIEVGGGENIPQEGEATVLCFNHGNSLGDAAVIIRCTPRMVRFCAKDGLFHAPISIYGTLIKGTGAVPVYRQREHGDNSKKLNIPMYEAVFGALSRGDMLGMAPEGCSRFLPFMSKPLKTGVARMALESVARNIESNPTFSVKLLPTGMIYMHREKFRSDVGIIYGEPIAVDGTWLKGDTEYAVQALMKLLTEGLEKITINCPEWDTTALAMTAACLHRPVVGTNQVGVVMHILYLRAWIDALKDTDDPPTKRLRQQLSDYHGVLQAAGISDECGHLLQVNNGEVHRTSCSIRMIQYAVLCMLLFICSVPGLVLWAPTWYLIRSKEKKLLSNGPTWADSLAEMKMLYGSLAVIFLILALSSMGEGKVICVILLYLWMVLRLHEEGVAAGRMACSLYSLMRMDIKTCNTISKARHDCKQSVLQYYANHKHAFANVGNVSVTKGHYFEHAWANWVVSTIIKRQKQDWNEVLRFRHHNSMDYID
eukprot:scaffold22_cov50-Attheya_sp.AAC.3